MNQTTDGVAALLTLKEVIVCNGQTVVKREWR